MKISNYPMIRVKKPEPNSNSPDWVIWAAWSDRVTFEEIRERTGKAEKDVIKIMRKYLKSNSFKLWRKRVKNKSTKHRKKFKSDRKEIRRKINKNDYI